MAEWEADCMELMARGYGSHNREDIPADWRTRPGPDSETGRRGQAAGRASAAKRKTFAQLREQRESEKETAA